MPETVAAPAAPAAPSTPAPAAPAAPSTPSAPVPPAAPSTPVAAPATPATPAAPSTPAKFDPQTSATPPNASDYPQNAEGNDQFMADNGAWLIAHPQDAARMHVERLREGDEPFTPAEDTPAPEAAKPAEDKPADAPAVPAQAATPAVIEEWTAKSPKLKEAFAENPELQAQVMELARGYEGAKPVLDIVGTVEEAQFAVDHANRLVSLQTNWMLSAEDPEMVGPAWDQTVDMFKERDVNGKEIIENGKPKLAADFRPFIHKAATAAMDDAVAPIVAQIATLQERLKGNYATEEARDADAEALQNAEYSKKAFDFVKEMLQPQGGSKLPKLPANATPEQIEYQKNLERQQAELDAKNGKTTVEARKAGRATLEKEVQTSYETGLTTYIDTQIAAMNERGEYLPDFVLNDKWINPATQRPTNLPAFGVKLYQALNAKILGNPTHKATLARLEAMGAAGKDARIAELTRLRNLYLPKLFDAEVKRIQDGIRNTAKPNPPAIVDPSGNNGGKPRVEPQSQATVTPSAMGDTQIMDWARAEAAKLPEFASSSPRDREELVMQMYAKKKYGA